MPGGVGMFKCYEREFFGSQLCILCQMEEECKQTEEKLFQEYLEKRRRVEGPASETRADLE